MPVKDYKELRDSLIDFAQTLFKFQEALVATQRTLRRIKSFHVLPKSPYIHAFALALIAAPEPFTTVLGVSILAINLSHSDFTIGRIASQTLYNLSSALSLTNLRSF